jgi:hypothetical protein
MLPSPSRRDDEGRLASMRYSSVQVRQPAAKKQTIETIYCEKGIASTVIRTYNLANTVTAAWGEANNETRCDE